MTGASSGGVLYKPDGRVGSAACYGAGCWAARGVGATASGTGELLIQAQLPRRVSEELIRARHKRRADGSSSTQPGGAEPSLADDAAEGIVDGIMQDFVTNRDGAEVCEAVAGFGVDPAVDEPAIGGVLVIQQKYHDADIQTERDREGQRGAGSSDGAHGTTSPSDAGVEAVGDFEILWSHNSRSFAVAYLSGQMDALRVPARCSFSRIRDTAPSAELRMRYASREVRTTCASVT